MSTGVPLQEVSLESHWVTPGTLTGPNFAHGGERAFLAISCQPAYNSWIWAQARLSCIIHVAMSDGAMSVSSSVSTTDSSSSSIRAEVEAVFEVLPFLPFCRCPIATLTGVLFVPDEPFGRCFECANRIDTGRLCTELRFEYIVSLVMKTTKA